RTRPPGGDGRGRAGGAPRRPVRPRPGAAPEAPGPGHLLSSPAPGLTAMPATTLPSRPHPAGPGPARPFAPRFRRGRVLVPSLLAGVLVALSVPPWGAWPLGPAGLGLLAWRLTGLPARTRVVAGLAAGFAWYMATLAWMAQFNLAGGFLAAVVEAGFVALACAAMPVG